MVAAIRPLVAGNWKMNGTSASLDELLAIGRGFTGELEGDTEALVCVRRNAGGSGLSFALSVPSARYLQSSQRLL
jgi:hypothetical protein